MKKTLILVAFAAWVGLIASNVRADTITLAVPTAVGVPSNFVGIIGDPEPSSLADERAYLQNLVTVPILTLETIAGREYDRKLSNLTPLPPVPTTGGVQGTAGDNTITVNFSGTVYVIGKYDGPNGGDTVWLVDFVSGDTIVLPLLGPSGFPANVKQYGLSHYAFFSTTSTVPEPGILILLGIAMSAVGVVSRYMRKI